MQQPKPQPQQSPNPLNPIAIGIDLGSLQSVLAIAQKTGLTVLTNQANFRQTPNIVGYSQSERYMGEAALTKFKTNFRDTVTYVTRFLGLRPERSEEERKFVMARVVTTEGGRLAFRVRYLGEEQTMLPEQVAAAFLTKLLNILQLNKLPRDQPIVLSVPPTSPIPYRKALLNSCFISNLKVSRLLNQSTAVAIDYASSRRNQFSKQPRYVLFVDFGHSKLTLSTVAFTREKIAVVSEMSEGNLGCRDMDWVMLEFYAEVFRRSSKGGDVMGSSKAVVKLLEVIEKQRKVLSANSQNTINVQCLLQQHDLCYTLRRQQFQSLIQPILLKLTQSLTKHKAHIDQLGLKLHNIELMGGGTRIPSVIKILQSVFKVDPARTINSSEAVAKGCAMMSAFKNPLFRPADFVVEEMNGREILAMWDAVGLEEEVKDLNKVNYGRFRNQSVLFPVGCTIPASRQLKLQRSQCTALGICYKTPTGYQPIIYIASPTPNNPPHTLTFTMTIDENHLLTLTSCLINDSEPAQAFPVYNNNLTQPMLEDLLAKQLTYQNQDKTAQSIYQFKNKLQSYLYSTKQKLSSTYKQYLSPEQHTTITTKFQSINQWLYQSDIPTAQKQLNNKSREISELLEPMNQRVRAYQEYIKALEEARKDMDELTRMLETQNQNTLHVPVRERQRGLAEVEKMRKYVAEVEVECQRREKYRQYDPSVGDVNRMMLTLREKVEIIMSKETYGATGGVKNIFDRIKKPW